LHSGKSVKIKFIIFYYSFKTNLLRCFICSDKSVTANKHRIAYLHYIQIGVNLQDGIMSLQKYSENKNKLLPSLLLYRRQQFFSYIIEKIKLINLI